MPHLSSTQSAAKSGCAQDAVAHLAEAAPSWSRRPPATPPTAAPHFDLVRAHGQAGGSRDAAALRRLDTLTGSHRSASGTTPVAREPLSELDRSRSELGAEVGEDPARRTPPTPT